MHHDWIVLNRVNKSEALNLITKTVQLVFSISLPFPLYQGNTLSVPNVVTSLVDFLTTYKRLWCLCVLAGASDSKNPKLYYYNILDSRMDLNLYFCFCSDSTSFCFLQVFNKFPSCVVGPFANIPYPEVTEVRTYFTFFSFPLFELALYFLCIANIGELGSSLSFVNRLLVKLMAYFDMVRYKRFYV